MKFILKTIFWLFIFLNTPLFASIDNTKHNLSTTSTGTIKAQSETEICVFCHIPHRANVDGKPLWNRSMPTSTYTMYNSDYLKRMGYAVENDLGTTNNTPGALSRQCLSCHDGTVAVGAVSVLHTLTDQTIAMAGVEADGTMPSTATGYIGTDLTMHHPVGIIYNPAPTKIFDDGTTRTMELKVSPDSPIRIFNYAGNNYVECSSCHDPHKDNDKFLRVDTGANLAQNVAATCTACHEKIDWVGSVHQSPPVGSPDYTDATLIANYGTAKIADISCSNCHMPHNAGGTPYLNRQVHEQTCFQGASSTTVGAACHGDNIGTAVDIESELKKNYAHPVISALYPGTGNHTNLDTLYGTGIVDPNGGGGIDWANNKHTSCMDCHNPHKSKPTTRVSNNPLDPNYWYPTTPTNLTSASGVLAGVTGVEPSWPTEWLQPNIFQTTEAATKEYQICFKCHSYWGIGDTINGISSTHFTPSSNYTVPMTDVAWSMNINNKSGHPVVI
ncbi:MAG: cytochrome c3 family protein, partial [Sulfurimonas sp.]|nr:cytochrome c3 family protein [Sulfurimonas sp.]